MMADSAEGPGPPAECQCTVVPVPVSFSRNDRQIGGRIGHLLGPGALAFALADISGMERVALDAGLQACQSRFVAAARP
jgi:hypothetical protein